LRQVGAHTRVRLIHQGKEIKGSRWDALVTTYDDWRSRRYEPIFTHNPQAVLVLADLYKSGETTAAKILSAGFKRLTDRAPVFTR